MADPIITNAQNAAATPANEPPSPVRERPGVGEQIRLDRERTAREAKAVNETKMSPAEQRVKKANANPALWDTKHKDHDAARKELREAVARATTPEEKQSMKDAPLESHREAFGLTVPDERVLPKHMLEDYDRDFSGHEQDFLLGARSAGLDSKLVGELRDAGIRMAMAAEGRPVSEEAWSAMEKRFAGRLTAKQFASLKAWWRSSVERT